MYEDGLLLLWTQLHDPRPAVLGDIVEDTTRWRCPYSHICQTYSFLLWTTMWYLQTELIVMSLLFSVEICKDKCDGHPCIPSENKKSFTCKCKDGYTHPTHWKKIPTFGQLVPNKTKFEKDVDYWKCKGMYKEILMGALKCQVMYHRKFLWTPSGRGHVAIKGNVTIWQRPCNHQRQCNHLAEAM